MDIFGADGDGGQAGGGQVLEELLETKSGESGGAAENQHGRKTIFTNIPGASSGVKRGNAGGSPRHCPAEIAEENLNGRPKRQGALSLTRRATDACLPSPAD